MKKESLVFSIIILYAGAAMAGIGFGYHPYLFAIGCVMFIGAAVEIAGINIVNAINSINEKSGQE